MTQKKDWMDTLNENLETMNMVANKLSELMYNFEALGMDKMVEKCDIMATALREAAKNQGRATAQIVTETLEKSCQSHRNIFEATMAGVKLAEKTIPPVPDVSVELTCPHCGTTVKDNMLIENAAVIVELSSWCDTDQGGCGESFVTTEWKVWENGKDDTTVGTEEGRSNKTD